MSEWYNSELGLERTNQAFAKSSLMSGAITTDDVRRRLWHYLSPAFAAKAGLPLEHLQQFADGMRELPRDTLANLAGRMNLL
jgi:hypothetical protein